MISWTIPANTVTVTNPGNQTGTVGTAVSLQMSASDSGSGQTLTYSASGLPAGLSIDSTSGLISGTPSTASTSSVTVTATDTTGAHGSASFTWTVNPAKATPSISTTAQPTSVTAGSPIADKATVSGGTNPTGTVTFNLYSNANASGTPLFTDTETLVGGSATSKSYTPTAAGTVYWVDTYSGDTNNNAVTSAPSAEPVTVTVTPTSLCLLTGQYVEGSAKFKLLPPLQRPLIEALVTAACGPLDSITSHLTAKQTAALVAAYDSAVNGLAAGSWLTPSQASILRSLAATL